MEAFLPHVVKAMAAKETGGSAFEHAHEIKQRALEVENEEVDMFGHDAESEHP